MNVLDLTPHRCASWEEREGRVVLRRPRPASRGARALLEWLAYLMAPEKLRLDPFGSFCWRKIDSSRRGREIAASLRREFGEASEPAEERVSRFFQTLAREDLLRFLELE